MPRVDPNANTSQEARHEVNHAAAVRVRKARKEVLPRKAKPYTPSKRQPVAPHGVETTDAPKPYVPSKRRVKVPAGVEHADSDAARTQHYAVALANKLVTKGLPLRKQQHTVHELARLGVLTPGYLSGLAARGEAQQAPHVTPTQTPSEIAAGYLSHTGMTPLERAQDHKDYLAAHAHPRAVPPSATAQAKSEETFRKTGKLPPALVHGTSNHLPKLVSALNNAPKGLINDAAALAAGTYHDPIGVPTKTAKQAALATAAIVPGLASTVLHPLDTGKALIDDYAKRNAETYKEKLARVRKEGGFAEVADLGTALSLGGGAAARTSLIRNAPERAAKLLSGGARKVPKKGGPVRYGIGRAVDARKAAKYEKIATKTEANAGTIRPHIVLTKRGPRLRQKPVGLTALQNEALLANRAAGHVVAVVPRNSGRKVAGVVADARGKAVSGLKYDLAKGPIHDLANERHSLNKDEMQALWLGTEAGIHDAAAARIHGVNIRDKMVAGRAAATPLGWEKDMDVLAHINKVLENPEKHFTQNFADTMKRIHEHAQEIADDEPQFAKQTKENRRRAVQAWTLGLERGVPKPRISAHDVAAGKLGIEPPPLKYADESDVDFNARVDSEARKAGLHPPTYFHSEKQQGLQTDYAAHVVGGTLKSTGRQYLGKNRDVGVFDDSYDQFLRGHLHNVKATHNYPLMAKLDDKNRLRSFSPDDEPQGAELGTLMNRVNQAEPRVAKGSVVFVNKGLFDKTLDDATEAIQTADPEARATEDAAARTALERSVVHEGDDATHLAKTPGWVAWPVEADRELQAELHAGSLGGRGLDVLKGNSSKAILLTSPPWLAIQTASEFAVTGIASKGRALTPWNAVGTYRWWKAMNHRQKTHSSTELALGATGSDTASIKLGSTTQNNLVSAWRDFKSADFWHQPRVAGQPVATIISPVKWMRAADQGKTNVTRLLHAHSELTKRITPEGQSHLAGALTNMASFGKAADRLLPVFGKPAAEQLDYLHAHPHVLEDIGNTVSTALGDFTSMTARERTWANRFVMFYPFIRYSTRLLTHTLPVDHPAVTSVLAELGQLKADEYRAIFGDDDLPWNIGKVYFGKTGESKYIDLNRANPVLNSAVSGLTHIGTGSSNVPGDIIGSLPPYFQWMNDHLNGVSSFKARPLRFNGETDPFWNKPADVSLPNHGKLFLAQIQSLMYPAREVMSRLHPESQSDESSLLFPTPMKYKAPSEIKGGGEGNHIRRLVAQNAVDNQQFNEEHNGGAADLLFGPLAPRPSRDAKAAQEREYIVKLKAKQAKGAAARKKYRLSHGGKNMPKPAGFGSSSSGGSFNGSSGAGGF